MLTKEDRQIIRKAAAFDLINIIENNPEKQTYTAEELKEIIDTYISSSEQK